MRFDPSPEQGRPTILMLPPSLFAVSSWKGVLLDLPLRATLSPADSLADIFHPPYPPIASQSISRDVPLARARAFQLSIPPFRGVAKAALYCAHRTTTSDLIDPFTLARLSLQGVAWLILECARRTSTFLSCAFREQEDDQAAHPTLGRF